VLNLQWINVPWFMETVVKIRSERLVIEEITWNDLNSVHHLHSFKEVDEFNTLGVPKNIDETKSVIKAILEDQKKQPQCQYHLNVCLSETGEFIGMAGISISRDKYKLGEIYYKLVPDFWGNGYATEIAAALINYGFEVFNLHKIEAGVATENHGSIRVLEKVGMTREGLRRKILPIRGVWKDNFHFGILENDPRPKY